MVLLEFKLWLESSNTATYNRYWAPVFEKLRGKRKNYFAHWFPEGQERIYIPVNLPKDAFSSDVRWQSEEAKKEVQAALKRHGFRIIDWAGGVCVNQRGQRIPIDQALSQSGEEDVKQNYLHLLYGKYTGVPINPKRNKWLIVISRDVNDIARMSTARHWDSCITLPLKFRDTPEGPQVQSYAPTDEDDPEKPGEKKWAMQWLPPEQDRRYQKLEREIISGGLVAYLTYTDDLELKLPIARLHLPRYENPVTKRSIIFCKAGTANIYGKSRLDFFVDTVKKWIDERQKEDEINGYYLRQETDWVEGTPWELFELNAKNEQELQQAIDYYINKDGTDSHVARQYVSAILGKINNGAWEVSAEFWDYLKDLVFNKGFDFLYVMKEINKKHPGSVSYEDLIKVKNPSDFFGTSLFGGFGEGYHDYAKWRAAELDKLLQDTSQVGRCLNIIKQMTYEIGHSALFEKVVEWAEKVLETGSTEEKEALMETIFDSFHWDTELYKGLNKILEKGYKWTRRLKDYVIPSYISDLDRKGFEKPKINLDDLPAGRNDY